MVEIRQVPWKGLQTWRSISTWTLDAVFFLRTFCAWWKSSPLTRSTNVVYLNLNFEWCFFFFFWRTFCSWWKSSPFPSKEEAEAADPELEEMQFRSFRRSQGTPRMFSQIQNSLSVGGREHNGCLVLAELPLPAASAIMAKGDGCLELPFPNIWRTTVCPLSSGHRTFPERIPLASERWMALLAPWRELWEETYTLPLLNQVFQ